MIRTFLVISVVSNAICAFAQDTSSVQVNVVKGVPFSAIATTETRQVLADGSQVTKTANLMEAWYSSDLQTVLLRKTTDPRSGETVYKVTNIDRSEPDASLFQVPVGFTIHQDAVVEK